MPNDISSIQSPDGNLYNIKDTHARTIIEEKTTSVDITKAEYDNLTDAEKHNGNVYYITDGDSSSYLSGSVIKAGIIAPYAGSTAPTGWLLCDGSAVSRSTYSLLFHAIGTTYGSGDGSTTFNLPDLQGRVPVGAGESDADGHSNHTLGEADGKEAYKLTASQSGMRAHTHNYSDTNTTYSFTSGYRCTDKHTQTGLASYTTGGGTTTRTSGDVNTISGADATDDHTNMPPYLSINYIISIGQQKGGFTHLSHDSVEDEYSGGIEDNYLLTESTVSNLVSSGVVSTDNDSGSIDQAVDYVANHAYKGYGTKINIESYKTKANSYVFPSDGLLRVISRYPDTNYIGVTVCNSDGTNEFAIQIGGTGHANVMIPFPVFKGQKAWASSNEGINNYIEFFPYIS